MMKTFFCALIVSFLSLSFSYANDLVDPLAGISVSGEEIMKGLDSMRDKGQISKDEYEKAKLQLANMNANDIKTLNETAIGMVRNNPDKAVELTKQPFNEAAVKQQLQDLSRPQE